VGLAAEAEALLLCLWQQVVEYPAKEMPGVVLGVAAELGLAAVVVRVLLV
jgi:phage shock protein PspC (stress-responsive transcriptional regulator)